MVKCINLKRRFGSKYRIGTDPSYVAETGSTTNNNRDPWLWFLRGSRGHICPWGGDLLAVCMNDGHSILSKRLAEEEWIVKRQWGSDGVNAIFHVDDFEKAAVYAKLHRRRQLSESDKERLRSRLAALRNSKNNLGK